MIVMASHGCRGLSAMLMIGSETQKVVNHSNNPVTERRAQPSTRCRSCTRVSANSFSVARAGTCWRKWPYR